jgi:ankyrin repeat protein
MLHDQLTSFISSTEYEDIMRHSDFAGVCKGFSLRWLQACLLSEEDEILFNKRLEQMLNIDDAPAFLEKIRDIEEQVKRKEIISEEDNKLLEIFSFCSGLLILQSPHYFRSLFGNNYDYSIENLSAIAGSKEVLNQGGLVEPYSESVIYTEAELINYFQDIQSILDSHGSSNEAVGFLLDSLAHDMAIIYQPQKGWKSMDINHYPFITGKKSPESSSSLIFRIQEIPFTDIPKLISTIKTGFEVGDYFAFFNQMICLGNYSHKNELKNIFEQFKNKHILTKEIANRQDSRGISLAHLAAKNGDARLVLELAKNQADLQLESQEYGYTPALFAAYGERSGCIKVIATLAELGVDLNQVCSRGTPIFGAALEDCPNAIRELAKAGADVNIPSPEGIAPLFIAAQEGNIHSVIELLKYGANVNAAFISNVQALREFALECGEAVLDKMNLYIERQLKEGGAQDHIALLPCDIADIMGHDEVVTFILCYEVDQYIKECNETKYIFSRSIFSQSSQDEMMKKISAATSLKQIIKQGINEKNINLMEVESVAAQDKNLDRILRKIKNLNSYQQACEHYSKLGK